MIRVGIGYDVHRLAPERALVLGGAEIPFPKGLLGWSDGDALVHAIIDALLGASASGDIGTYFPPGDPAYQGISSLKLLNQVGDMLRSNGWSIGNIDATIIAEEPRLSPFIGRMAGNITEALRIDKAAVGIKAKTNEGLGFLGQGEAIAVYAVALVEREDESS